MRDSTQDWLLLDVYNEILAGILYKAISVLRISSRISNKCAFSSAELFTQATAEQLSLI